MGIVSHTMALRSSEMNKKYAENQAQYADFSATKSFDEDAESIIHQYKHWYIIKNLFPYDTIAQVHDMLVPNRVFGKMSLCNKVEWEEYKTIITQLEEDGYYDAILENFSKNRSVPKHLHLHLIVWKH